MALDSILLDCLFVVEGRGFTVNDPAGLMARILLTRRDPISILKTAAQRGGMFECLLTAEGIGRGPRRIFPPDDPAGSLERFLPRTGGGDFPEVAGAGPARFESVRPSSGVCGITKSPCGIAVVVAHWLGGGFGGRSSEIIPITVNSDRNPIKQPTRIPTDPKGSPKILKLGSRSSIQERT